MGPLRSSSAMEAPLTAAKTAAASRSPPTPRWRLLPRAASLPPQPSCSSSLLSQRQGQPHRRKSRRPSGGNLRAPQLSRCRCITIGMKLPGVHRHQAQVRARSWALGPRVLMWSARQHLLLLCHHPMLLQRSRLLWATAKDLWTGRRTHPGLRSLYHHPLSLAVLMKSGRHHGLVRKGRVIPYPEALKNLQTVKEATRCLKRKRRLHPGIIC